MGEIFKTTSGGTPLSSCKEYYDGGNIPWINSGELNTPFINAAEHFITPIGLKSSSAKMLPVDSVLIAMYGATAGRASLLKIPACVNQAICAVLPSKNYSPLFLKYYLDTIYQHLVDLSSGSARSNLSQEVLQKVKIPFPDLPTQLRIAAILGSIDKKIELNRKKIAELEALAKTIYDYWFVQFDFPDKNGKPYKSSGGKMVWNEQLKREIPDGWEVAQIKTICKIRSGHPFQAKTFKSNGIYGIVTIKNVQDGRIDFPSEAFIDKYPDSIPSEFILKQGDILMSLTGYVGRVGLVTFSDCLLNQRVAIILPKLDIYKCYLYCLFRSKLMKSKIENLSTGCAQKNVSPVDCENIFIPFNAKYVSHFQAVIESTTNEYINLSRQTQQLVNLRDTLLPLLMNGQVEVKE